MKIYNRNIVLPENVKFQNTKSIMPVEEQTPKSKDFKEILTGKIYEQTPMQFSKHAVTRLNSREINLSREQIERVENGIKKAKDKGINDSLILVDNIALLVNIKNNTVITAMQKGNENIFTNIDGTVIV